MPMSRLVVERVAPALGSLLDQLVLVGGCAAAFLVPQPEDRTLRPTEDVDYIVPAFSYGEFAEWETRLRQLGFTECPDEGVICRWMVNGIRVDFMPVEGRILGFTNRWYAEAVRDPELFALKSGLQVRVVNVPVFLATKFEAFGDRGGGDYAVDSDIEDVITVLAFRPESADLIAAAAPEVREYLCEQVIQLLGRADVQDIIGGCFDPPCQSEVCPFSGSLRSSWEPLR